MRWFLYERLENLTLRVVCVCMHEWYFICEYRLVCFITVSTQKISQNLSHGPGDMEEETYKNFNTLYSKQYPIA